MKKLLVLISLMIAPLSSIANETAFDDKAAIVIATESGGSISATKLYVDSKLITRLQHNEVIILEVGTGEHEVLLVGNGSITLQIQSDQYSISTIKVESKFFGENPMAGGIHAYLHEGEYKVNTSKQRKLDISQEFSYLTLDGAVYKGEITNDEPNGAGTLTYPNGVIMQGKFKNGLADGQVFVIYPNGNSYSGQAKNSKFHGDGTFTFSDGASLSGEFKNNSPYQGELKFANGALYRGSFSNWKSEGKGNFYTDDGLRLSGNFKEGKFYKGDVYNQSGNLAAKFSDGKISNASSVSSAEAIGYAIEILAGAAHIYNAYQRNVIISNDRFIRNTNSLNSSNLIPPVGYKNSSDNYYYTPPGKPALPMDRAPSGYRSIMGTAYQYDMSDPVDRIEYEIDPDAQLRDRMGKLNPIHGINQGIERSIGERGAGAPKSSYL